MKFNRTYNSQIGFTLIEMLVSLALFTVVSTITVGALLSLIGGNQRLVKQQTLTSSAIFSLDNMTREIRTGGYYYCGDSVASRGFEETADCSGGNTAVSFVESSTRTTGPQRISYYFANGSLWRQIGAYTPANPSQKLLPDDVEVDDGASKFFVTGTDTLTRNSPASYTDVAQPTVTIVMVFKGGPDEIEPVTLQTTITQRSLDI